MKSFLLVLVTVASLDLHAQNGKLTTFILVRHAEKVADGTNDPDLSDAGRMRAENLKKLLEKTKIDVIYSTPFRRTRNTVQPMAQSYSLVVKQYEAGKLEEIDKMLAVHEGKTILVCGHSNTIPKIVNYLTKSGGYADFNDTDYGNILIVTVESALKSANVTWLQY